MRLCSFHDGDVVRVGILFEVDGFPALENRVA